MLDVCQYQFMSKYIDGYKQGTENSVLTTLTHGKQHPLNNILVFWQKNYVSHQLFIILMISAKNV